MYCMGNKQVIGLNAVEVSQCYKDMKNDVAILLKRLRFERYGVKTGEKANTHKFSTGLPRPGLARSAHRLQYL